MGAIGGIVDFKNGNIDFSSFNAVRSAQILRGRMSSVAYCDSGIGMFYNSDGFFECEQPIISERKGYRTAFVIDSPFFQPKAAIEAYHTYGVELVGMLDTPFAIALYDGKRRMLLLARDKKGKKPLYYRLKSGRVIFSSEPKGILATEGTAIRVNNEILSSHLTSPTGIYGAADIYSDIYEVRRGECILFSEIGISKFFYRENNHKRLGSKNSAVQRDIAIEPSLFVDKQDALSSLDDMLIAFDMPQFDSYMPSVCQLFLYADNSTAFSFADYIKRYNIYYSYEREDRMSAFYGKVGVGVMSRLDEGEVKRLIHEEYKMNILKALKDAIFSLERSEMLFLRDILGDARLNCILKSVNNIKKENTDDFIRILGMLYQAVKWSKLRELELVK